MRVYDALGTEVGCIKEKILTWIPKFEMYLGDTYAGSINKELSFFRPRFNVEYNGWQVEGDWTEWDYSIIDTTGRIVADITKDVWNFTDTYVIDVYNPNDAVCALMLVLAIDAEKCSRN